MPSEFDIQYALEQTRVLHEPDRRIDTFGSTQFEFQIVSELMDTVSTCRVRQGRIEAHKPLLFRPDHNLAGFDFDGFSPEAQAFGAWLKDTTRADGNPMRAIIQGVDDTWEISLLKFTVDMIAKSQGINVFDFKRRGLL